MAVEIDFTRAASADGPRQNPIKRTDSLPLKTCLKGSKFNQEELTIFSPIPRKPTACFASTNALDLINQFDKLEDLSFNDAVREFLYVLNSPPASPVGEVIRT
ncbi:hypothetical protein HK099_006712 [Clydaea vesicula]|uniref:Uncharacterized protein n=1 Tax=Clydaea vesicula TaxID=447962 RepID=A0AAD5U806_9FUNG|nr:hypothetical protein HK099_006712 [Clydaea vesicula]KAJ3396917.1 hypothetical protein HDU92_001490 [Lobulomyces angularis]